MFMYFFKMVPSDDPLPFKMFLGYMDYPTDKEFVAMAEMPQQGTTQGDESVCFEHGMLLLPIPLNRIF